MVCSASAAAHAGYEFSLSASSNDPQQNAAPPAAGYHSIYLWATCIDDGLAAFEAELETSVAPLGFVPLNGVLNAGTSVSLLLAIPDCPFGIEVNHALGYWTVLDAGGGVSLCLGPSANGPPAAIDCATTPTATIDVVVRGFSSSGQPCAVGSAGCTPPSGGQTSGYFGN